MTIQHEFFIQRIYTLPQVDNLQNVVAKVEWKALLSRNVFKSVAAGKTLLNLSELNSGSFTPISDLSAATVLNWVIESEGGEGFLTRLKEVHAAIIAAKEYEANMQVWDIPLIEPKRWDEAYARR